MTTTLQTPAFEQNPDQDQRIVDAIGFEIAEKKYRNGTRRVDDALLAIIEQNNRLVGKNSVGLFQGLGVSARQQPNIKTAISEDAARVMGTGAFAPLRQPENVTLLTDLSDTGETAEPKSKAVAAYDETIASLNVDPNATPRIDDKLAHYSAEAKRLAS